MARRACLDHPPHRRCAACVSPRHLLDLSSFLGEEAVRDAYGLDDLTDWPDPMDELDRGD